MSRRSVTQIIFAKVVSLDSLMVMKAGRGIRSLGWAALLFGAVVGRLWAQPEVRERWFYATGNTGQSYVYSSPVIGPDGTIYVGVAIDSTVPKQGRLLALTSEGAEKEGWPRGGLLFTGGMVHSSPAMGLVSDAVVYVGCDDGNLYAVNTSNGRIKWQRNLFGIVASSPAVGPDGTVYVGSYDGHLYALNPGNGAVKWASDDAGAIESSPAIAPDGSVYFGSTDKSVYALLPNGRTKWRYTTGDIVLSSPAIGADGTIYIGSRDKTMYALSPTDGTVLWSFASGGDILSSPVIGPDRTVYFGNDAGRFMALTPDLKLKWSISVGAAAIRSTALVRSDGTIIFGANDGVVRAVSPGTTTTPGGQVVWKFTADEAVESSPVAGDDITSTIFVGSYDGKLYALPGSGARASVYGRWPMFRQNAAHSAVAPLVAESGQLINLSSRAQVSEGRTMIAGLAMSGSATKEYLLRGVGPGLAGASANLASALRDPSISIFSQDVPLFSNDDWGGSANAARIRQKSAEVGAFALGEGSKDAVVLQTLPGGLYTAKLSGAAGDSGIALVEAYDTEVANPSNRLINLSTRAQVGATEEQSLIAGVVIGGGAPVRVLVRGVGPGLAAFGVNGTLARPSLSVFNSAGNLLLTNTGWSTSVLKGDMAGAAALAGAFPLAEGSADSAALITSLQPGAYTIQIKGVSGATGEALVEIYLLP